MGQASQFVALSKVLDSTELGLLVRIKMGITAVDVEGIGTDGDFHNLGAATSNGNKSTQQSSIAVPVRVGRVLVHDPSDVDLTYKLQFEDGSEPSVDWFSQSQ